MIRHWLFVALVMATLFVTACNKKEDWMQPKTGLDQVQATSQSQPGHPPDAQADREAYLQSARVEIDAIRAKIDALTAKADNAAADLREAMKKRNGGFQNDLKAVELKWQDVKNASIAKWQDLKKSLSESIGQLEQAVNKASNQG